MIFLGVTAVAVAAVFIFLAGVRTGKHVANVERGGREYPDRPSCFKN